MKSLLKRIFGKPAPVETELQKRIRLAAPLKIIVGAGGLPAEAPWITTEVTTLDVTDKNNWETLLRGKNVDTVFAEHVWEHLNAEQTEAGNKNIFHFLKKGGRFRLAVPDGLHPDEEYINYVKPGGHGAGADDHKILYTYELMKKALEKAGFKVELLEYWDENGKFHFTDWSSEHGKVMRSRRYDQRNAGGELKYTSLIVDAIKP